MASRLKFKPIDPAHWGKLQWIYVKDIVIPDDGPDSYQRGEITAHVREIASEFDPWMFGAITLVRRMDLRGTLECADGGHRVRGVRLRNENAFGVANTAVEKVPAYVIDANSAAEAASIFARINTARRAVAWAFLEGARGLAGDPHVLNQRAIATELKDAGVTFDGSKYLTVAVSKPATHSAVKRLLPLLIDLGTEAPDHRISVTLLKALVRLECDMAPQSLSDAKWKKKLLREGVAGINKAFAGVEYGRRDAISYARVLVRLLRIRPNPYIHPVQREEGA